MPRKHKATASFNHATLWREARTSRQRFLHVKREHLVGVKFRRIEDIGLKGSGLALGGIVNHHNLARRHLSRRVFEQDRKADISVSKAALLLASHLARDAQCGTGFCLAGRIEHREHRRIVCGRARLLPAVNGLRGHRHRCHIGIVCHRNLVPYCLAREDVREYAPRRPDHVAAGITSSGGCRGQAEELVVTRVGDRVRCVDPAGAVAPRDVVNLEDVTGSIVVIGVASRCDGARRDI